MERWVAAPVSLAHHVDLVGEHSVASLAAHNVGIVLVKFVSLFAFRPSVYQAPLWPCLVVLAAVPGRALACAIIAPCSLTSSPYLATPALRQTDGGMSYNMYLVTISIGGEFSQPKV